MKIAEFEDRYPRLAELLVDTEDDFSMREASGMTLQDHDSLCFADSVVFTVDPKKRHWLTNEYLSVEEIGKRTGLSEKGVTLVKEACLAACRA